MARSRGSLDDLVGGSQPVTDSNEGVTLPGFWPAELFEGRALLSPWKGFLYEAEGVVLEADEPIKDVFVHPAAP